MGLHALLQRLNLILRTQFSSRLLEPDATDQVMLEVLQVPCAAFAGLVKRLVADEHSWWEVSLSS